MHMKKTTKNILAGGTGLMLGSMTMGKIAGTSSDPNVGKIASTGQSALGIGSVGLTIGASKGVIGQLDSLMDSTKRRKKK